MTDFESVREVSTFEHRPDHRRGKGTLFVLTGVHYQPRWSLEVTAVEEFPTDRLPGDTAPITRRLLAISSIS